MEVKASMVDEEKDNIGESENDEVLEEIVKPSSKYERIMMAAAEAARLNEMGFGRREGEKSATKVTIEALRRVDEGKVKVLVLKPGAKGDVPKKASRPEEGHEEPPFMAPPLDEEQGTQEPAEDGESE